MFSSAAKFVANAVPAPIRHLIAYPINQATGKEIHVEGYQFCAGPAVMVSSAIRIALAAGVLWMLPQFTISSAVALGAAGIALSIPTTALVGGSLLLKAAWISFQGAIAVSSAPLAAKALLIGFIGYQVINRYTDFSLFGFPGFFDGHVIWSLGMRANQCLPPCNWDPLPAQSMS